MKAVKGLRRSPASHPDMTSHLPPLHALLQHQADGLTGACDVGGSPGWDPRSPAALKPPPMSRCLPLLPPCLLPKLTPILLAYLHSFASM